MQLHPQASPMHNPSHEPMHALSPAFMARPVGAVMFGAVGDLKGRRQALVATLLLMGTATTLVGCLPNYAHIGVAAPALLAVLRIVVGLSMGSEYTTAVRTGSGTALSCPPLPWVSCHPPS